jgi:hypothetical protein
MVQDVKEKQDITSKVETSTKTKPGRKASFENLKETIINYTNEPKRRSDILDMVQSLPGKKAYTSQALQNALNKLITEGKLASTPDPLDRTFTLYGPPEKIAKIDKGSYPGLQFEGIEKLLIESLETEVSARLSGRSAIASTEIYGLVRAFESPRNIIFRRPWFRNFKNCKEKSREEKYFQLTSALFQDSQLTEVSLKELSMDEIGILLEVDELASMGCYENRSSTKSQWMEFLIIVLSSLKRSKYGR